MLSFPLPGLFFKDATYLPTATRILPHALRRVVMQGFARREVTGPELYGSFAPHPHDRCHPRACCGKDLFIRNPAATVRFWRFQCS